MRENGEVFMFLSPVIFIHRKFTWQVDIWVSPRFSLLENLEPIQLRERAIPFTKFVPMFQRSEATRMEGKSVDCICTLMYYIFSKYKHLHGGYLM